jgi:oxygen-independent coproporphyrinogen-3 oxidase
MNYSLYFHVPFCTHRCAYCDFNTYAGQEALIPAYVEAICNEVRLVAASAPERLLVHTVFFGGGTPSLLTPKQFEQILQTVHDHFDLYPSDSSGTSETSLEANPGTVTPDSLQGLRRAGFNRISFGVQSAHPDELRQLERIHDFFDVIQSVKWARQAGFDNLNLDLIYGLPEQRLSRWQESIRRAVDLGPQHLSLYALTVEHGTPFGRWAARGLLPMPDPDLAADMYEWAANYLEGQGYEQYEISNWSKPGFQCKHNLQYWRNQPYLGFGAGAHGCVNGLRISNVLRIKTYIERLHPNYLIPDYLFPNTPFPLSPATVNQTRLTPHVEMQETMMLGLRLTHEGVSTEGFRACFRAELQDVFGKEIDELVGLGLLEWRSTDFQTDKRMEPDSSTDSEAPKERGQADKRMGTDRILRLTKRGRLLGNQVFMRFVGDPDEISRPKTVIAVPQVQVNQPCFSKKLAGRSAEFESKNSLGGDLYGRPGTAQGHPLPQILLYNTIAQPPMRGLL